MNGQFKPGDLALVIGSVHCPGNVGKVVTLVCYIPPDARIFHGGFSFIAHTHSAWVIQSDVCDLEVYFPSTKQTIAGYQLGVSQERHLMPLPKDAVMDARQTVVSIPCKV